MTRPAAPDLTRRETWPNTESETPETDALTMDGAKCKPGMAYVFAQDARSIERRLSLAQTEIKGHMRVEEELKAQLAAWQEHGKTYGFICGRFECDEAGKYHIFQNEGSEFDKAQARIAELEKAIQRVVETDDFDDLELDDGLWANSARRFLQAALKDRA